MTDQRTDQEIAQIAHDRILQREAEAKATGNRKLIVALAKLHKALDKAWADIQPFLAGGIQPFGGGTPKPPRP